VHNVLERNSAGPKPERHRVRAELGSNSLFTNEHELKRIESVRWLVLEVRRFAGEHHENDRRE
jgi:hypothetical protein